MQRISNATDFHLVAKLPQFFAVGFPLVAQWIILGRDDQRAGLAAEIFGNQWRELWIGQVLVAAAIQGEVLLKFFGSQEIVGSVFSDRRVGRRFRMIIIGTGID